MQRTMGAALAVALALGLASCGGKSPLTTAEFVKQAQAVCVKARAATQKMPSKGLDGMVNKFTAFQRAKLKGIAALTPPAELQPQYDRFRRLITQRSAYLRTSVVAVKTSGRAPAPERAVKTNELQYAEENAAHAMHLTKCLETPQHWTGKA